MLHEIVQRVRHHPFLDAGAIVFSLVLAVVSTLLVVRLAARVPADFFVRGRPPSAAPWRILRLLGGSTVMLLGAIMLVLPGPGLLTIVIGLLFLDGALARAAALRLLRVERLLHAVNSLRQRHQQPPLILPPSSD